MAHFGRFAMGTPCPAKRSPQTMYGTAFLLNIAALEEHMILESEVREPYESDIIPLRKAVLCPECDCVSLSTNGRCRVCNSEALSLAMVLNRKVAACIPAVC
jgi:hypothetical protein